MPKQTGFTLIELMVTVAIVGILATIAATSYQTQIVKSRRTDARTALLDMAGREEKLFSTTNAYGTTPASLGYGTGTGTSVAVGSGYYNVTVNVPDPAQANAAGTFSLVATPTGPQTSDTLCLTLSVNQLGQQSSTGSASTATCWGTSS
jgi:type IV pilus assembly protein PilE